MEEGKSIERLVEAAEGYLAVKAEASAARRKIGENYFEGSMEEENLRCAASLLRSSFRDAVREVALGLVKDLGLTDRAAEEE